MTSVKTALTCLVPLLLLEGGATFGAETESAAALAEVRTLDAATGVGIKAWVELVMDDNSTKNLGRTDDQGVRPINPPIQCKGGMQIKVKPRSALYFDTTKDLDCDLPEVVELKKALFGTLSSTSLNLIQNIDFMTSIGDSATVSLLYSDLAAGLAAEYPALAQEYRARTFYEFADALEYRGDVWKVSDSEMTPEFVAEIKEWQLSKELEASGELDYRTLSSAAGSDLFWYKFQLAEQGNNLSANANDLAALCARPQLVQVAQFGAVSPQVDQLARLAINKEKDGQWADAGLAWTEVAARSRDVPELAELAGYQAFMSAGTLLGVEDYAACDPLQGRHVLTPAFARVLQEYNASNGIDAPNGNLNNRVFRSLGASSIGMLLKEANEYAVEGSIDVP